MRICRFLSSAVAVSLLAGAMAAGARAQQEPATRHFPKPKNLKVLPKNLTGDQVHKIMRGWAGALGQKCSACHAQFPDHRKNARGFPELDFPSDANPRKQMARIMVRMVRADRTAYIAKVNDIDKKMDENRSAPPPAPLTCGTCHRGHLHPRPYIPPQRQGGGPGPGF